MPEPHDDLFVRLPDRQTLRDDPVARARLELDLESSILAAMGQPPHTRARGLPPIPGLHEAVNFLLMAAMRGRISHDLVDDALQTLLAWLVGIGTRGRVKPTGARQLAAAAVRLYIKKGDPVVDSFRYKLTEKALTLLHNATGKPRRKGKPAKPPGARPTARRGLGAATLSVIVPEQADLDEVAGRIAELIHALSAYHIAMGGSGLRIDEWDTFSVARGAVVA